MECSQEDVVNDFIALEKIGSEVDINLDGVIKSKECSNTNEADIISNLITAIEESLSCTSVCTAVSLETVAQKLDAYADPSLNTQMSFSTASDLSSMEQDYVKDDPFDLNHQPSPLQVWRDQGKITGFQMMCDDQKVTVVDSLECLAQSEQHLEPVYFDPRVNLAIPCPPDDFEILEDYGSTSNASVNSDDASTAELGPTSEEFEEWVRKIEQNY
ncbi:Ovule protein [Caenorhabditis elegans]|uniref:Ovule protein n=1 Tax=Caenorhabditis elegans TaxID=6239 RepID=Q6LAA9_CAEEL|nr:Ovule protein [Caenorhabditis elegans]CAE48820.1 Ovule protein [Caenorhabditis elegans]|eukprot:NP_001022538.1 Uncharacterized protein CELE_ZK945.6 [Caenorhabditis elegans]